MSSEQTATERLRELLDENGVEWAYGGFLHSTYFVVDGVHYSAYEQGGKLYLKASVGPITPEQAIDVTLARGTCHIVKTWSDSDYDEDWRYRCSECGCFIGVYERDPETGDVISADNYCPTCGRKVVDE